MDFRGFDSSTILILRGGISRPKGNFPESLSQAILVGIMLVGRLGVPPHVAVDLQDVHLIFPVPLGGSFGNTAFFDMFSICLPNSVGTSQLCFVVCLPFSMRAVN